MAPILVFFVGHWWLSIFCQTFFLHRYSAHRQFRMSRGWEKFFHVLTWAAQGSSYLEPRAYAILHRMHHAYSDTDKDPHSPVRVPNLFKMMWRTKRIYSGLRDGSLQPEARFAEGEFPRDRFLDGAGNSWPMSIAWGAAYTLFYAKFATAPWMYGLLFFHYFMGPVHGAIVNWCGHKYGYRNFAQDDDSRNTLVFDFVTLGELFQNNHHKFGMSPNFAVRGFEVDPCYQVMRVLHAIGVIDMSGAQKVRWSPAGGRARSGGKGATADRLPARPAPMDAE